MWVIADDITGAAELAGIAYSQGLPVRLLCAPLPVSCNTVATPASSPVCCNSVATPASITVVATDTRSMTEAEAVAETRRVAASLPPSASPLFKKTDSALRGHVVAELEALLQATGYRRAVYLPANPSKGRIVRNGMYYIKEASGKGQEVPIHKTAFSYDPEFPARTSSLRERFPGAEAAGIILPDAVTTDDIRRVVEQYNDGQTLFAGAADLFVEVLKTHQATHQPHPLQAPFEAGHSTPLPLWGGAGGGAGNCLILCGSTQSKPLDLGIAVAAMPREVYDGEQDAAYWFQRLSTSLPTPEGAAESPEAQSLILTIPHTHRTGKEAAVHLRTTMAAMARLLVSRHMPTHLVIEGGATAWATLQALGWADFEVTAQYAPGVVQMRSVTSGVLVTLKPGSYPWKR